MSVGKAVVFFVCLFVCLFVLKIFSSRELNKLPQRDKDKLSQPICLIQTLVYDHDYELHKSRNCDLVTIGDNTYSSHWKSVV